MAADKDDPDRRLFLAVKDNLAANPHGLAYRIKAGPAVEWEAEPVTITADEALGCGAANAEGSALAEAMDWLRDALRGGPRPAKETKDEAQKAGIALRTLDRAKAKLQVEAGPDGFEGPWVWRLPDGASARQSAPDSPKCATPETLAHSGETGALCGKESDDWGAV